MSAAATAGAKPAAAAAPRKGQAVLFLSWDGTTESSINVTLLRRFLLAKGYFLYESSGAQFGNGSVLAEVPEEVVQQLRASTAFVVCVSRAYTRNLSCKKVSLLAREMKFADPKTAPESVFVMIDGNYTTESQPYKVSGWLGHLLKDSLWSPAWSHAHAAGAAEAIMGVVNLKRKVVIVTKEELRRIDRGEENSPKGSGSPKSSGRKSRGGAGSSAAGQEGFAVGNPGDEHEALRAALAAVVPAAPAAAAPVPLKSILKTSASAPYSDEQWLDGDNS